MRETRSPSARRARGIVHVSPEVSSLYPDDISDAGAQVLRGVESRNGTHPELAPLSGRSLSGLGETDAGHVRLVPYAPSFARISFPGPQHPACCHLAIINFQIVTKQDRTDKEKRERKWPRSKPSSRTRRPSLCRSSRRRSSSTAWSTARATSASTRRRRRPSRGRSRTGR